MPRNPKSDRYPLTRANKRRVNAAADLLAQVNPRVPDEPHETNVIDLLSNVMHFCAANGLDYDNLQRIAAGHFRAESVRSHPEFAEMNVPE